MRLKPQIIIEVEMFYSVVSMRQIDCAYVQQYHYYDFKIIL